MSLKKKAIAGTMWTTISSMFLALIQVLRLSILTRFLERSDFGLVAIIVLVLGFTHIFADLGVSVSLFSRQDVSKKEYSSLYWVSLILGISIYCILFSLTPIIAGFYKMPQLNALIPLMGIDLIITTAGRQFRVFSQKQLQFKKLAIIDISCSFLSLGIAVWIAVCNGGVYSLILSTLSASLMATILLVITGLKTHPMTFYINVKEGREFYKIGIYQIGSEILDYISSQLDILIIGKIMSLNDLGIYNLVKQLALRIYNIIIPIITSVAVPLLSTINDNSDELSAKYIKMVRTVAFVNIPIYTIVAILAKEVLTILYGSAYTPYYSYLQILCFWGAIIAVMSAASSIVIIRGRTDLGFKWTILRILTNPVFVIVGSFWGFKGIVIGQATCAIFYFSLYWIFLIRKVLNNVSFTKYGSTCAYYLLVCSILFIFLFFAKTQLLDKANNIWINIFAILPIFGLLYFITNKKMVKELIQLIITRKI